MTLTQVLMLVVISLTSWTALSLWVDRRGERAINRWFAGILLALCIPQTYFYSLTLTPGGWDILGRLSQTLVWAKGPLMLVFVSLAIAQPLRRPLVYFVPFFAVALSILLLNAFNHWLGLAGAVYALVYLAIAVRQLVCHRQRVAHIYIEFKNSAYYWLLFVIVAMAVMLAIDFGLVAGFMLQKLYWLDVARILTWCMSFYLIVVAIFSLYRPELFYQIGRNTASRDSSSAIIEEIESHMDETTMEPEFASVSNDVIVEETRSGKELDPSSAELLALELERLMVDEQLYLRNELSLPMLAEALGITVHQTSELLNIHLNVSFYDYLNRLRVQHACKLLDDSNCKLRIIDLAFASGFNNKNSFYRSFRAHAGTTPADYRNRRTNAYPPTELES